MTEQKMREIVKISDDLLESITSEIYKKAEEVIKNLEDWFVFCVHLDGHGIKIPPSIRFLRYVNDDSSLTIKYKILPKEPWIIIGNRIFEKKRIKSINFEDDPFGISIGMKDYSFELHNDFAVPGFDSYEPIVAGDDPFGIFKGKKECFVTMPIKDHNDFVALGFDSYETARLYLEVNI